MGSTWTNYNPYWKVKPQFQEHNNFVFAYVTFLCPWVMTRWPFGIWIMDYVRYLCATMIKPCWFHVFNHWELDVQIWDFLCQWPCIQQILFHALVMKETCLLTLIFIPSSNEWTCLQIVHEYWTNPISSPPTYISCFWTFPSSFKTFLVAFMSWLACNMFSTPMHHM